MTDDPRVEAALQSLMRSCLATSAWDEDEVREVVQQQVAAADQHDARDAEIKRLREALRWYANPERYDLCVFSNEERGGYTCDIIMDRGRKAARALQGGDDEG